MSIADALRLKPVQRELPDGTPYWLRRPSAADLIEAIEFSKATPEKLHAWLAWKHLYDLREGILEPVFESMDEALAATATTVTAIGQEAERLYSEGRD